MKGMLLVLFTGLYLGAFAQITVTDATFPDVGDTLRFAVDTDVSGNSSVLTPPGGNQLWDFTDMEADSETEIAYTNAANGVYNMSFPGADLAVVNAQGESYYNNSGSTFEIVGFAGPDPTGFIGTAIANFNPALVERHTPLNFFDVNSYSSQMTIPFSAEDIPDTLFSGAPFVPDSIRINITTNRVDLVDAWGTCFIPGGEYQVLRLKREEFVTRGMEVKVPFLNWIDVASFLPNGGNLGGLIGSDTLNTYHFISGTEKEEIAVVSANIDWSEAEEVLFKNNETTPAFTLNAPGRAGISAFPNPAVEWVRFDCTNLPTSDYTLKIFNIVGKVVWKKTMPLSGNKSFKVELEDFKKGTYLYSLSDKGGKVVGTKRLVVLKP